MEFEHELALTQFKLDYKKLPLGIKGSINSFKGRKAAMEAKKPYNKAEELKLKIFSATIADDIITYFESTKPDVSAVALAKEELTEAQKAAMVAKYEAARLARKNKPNDK